MTGKDCVWKAQNFNIASYGIAAGSEKSEAHWWKSVFSNSNECVCHNSRTKMWVGCCSMATHSYELWKEQNQIHLKSSWNPFEMLLKSMSHGNTLIWVVKDKELHNVIYWEQTDHLRVEIELILQQTACIMIAHNSKHPVLGTLTFAACASLTLRSSLPVWSLVTSGKAFWLSALSEVSHICYMCSLQFIASMVTSQKGFWFQHFLR